MGAGTLEWQIIDEQYFGKLLEKMKVNFLKDTVGFSQSSLLTNE